MEGNSKKYHCITCNIDIDKSQKSRHIKSKTHLENEIKLKYKDDKSNILETKLNELKNKKEIYKCDICNQSFTEKRYYNQHLKTPGHIKKLNNEVIGTEYFDNNNDKKEKIIKRINDKFKNKKPYMENVGDYINSLDNKKDIEIKEAFKSEIGPAAIEFRFHKGKSLEDFNVYLDIMKQIINIITDVEYPKISISAKVRFIKFENKLTYDIQSYSQLIISKQHIKNKLNICFEEIKKHVEERYYEGSGLTLDEIIFMTLHVYNTKHNKVSKSKPIDEKDLSYYKDEDIKASSYVKLPFESKAVINVQNFDDKCFLWSIISCFYPTEDITHRYRVSNYKQFENKYKIESYPVTIKMIPKIERNNNLKINVFDLIKLPKTKGNNIKHYTLEALYLTKDYDTNDVIDILYYENHYMYIKQIDLFFKGAEINKIYLCRKCLNKFSNESALLNHKKSCDNNDYCKLILPTDKNYKLEFKKYGFKNKVPFVIYGDFESLNFELTDKDRKEIYYKRKILNNDEKLLIFPEHSFDNDIENEYPDPPVSSTIKKIHQSAAAFGLYIKSEYPELFKNEYYSYRSENVINHFCDLLIEYERKFNKLLNTNKEIIMTSDDIEDFNFADKCYYCDKVFESSDKKVRDHDHLSGRYRGAAHNSCNLNAKQSNFVPVIFHNLSGYDAHLFIKQLCHKIEGINTEIELLNKNRDKGVKKIPLYKFRILAKTSENYISFQFGCLRFLDSYRFLSSSLDNLAKSLIDNELKILKEYYPNDNDFQLMRYKGAIPYSFYKTHEDFNVTELLKEQFYDELRDEYVKDEVYERTLNIWNHFKCKNHGDLVDIYLKSDVLLLTDIFESFRDVNLKYFEIDPGHCYSSPGLTWDCGLKFTGIKLDLLKEIDQVLLFEKAIRGGVSGVLGDRYFNVNDNPGYKLLYIDANNLYGYAMMQPQPYGLFELTEVLENEENNKFDWKSRILEIKDDAPTGYFFVVDLKYPDEIKFKSRNLAYCPEHKIVSDEELSDYQKKIKPENHLHTQKLMLTQEDKYNYVVHYRMLKFYLNSGMILKKVHKYISFSQSKWLEKYIDFNTKQRTIAKTEFKKDFFKLLNNAFFGKTLENTRAYNDIELVSNGKRIRHLQSYPRFVGNRIFDENLAAVQMKRTSMKFNKPIYVGATVLELSKLLMYEFYYNVLQHHFGEKHIEIMYFDTDSYILKIKTDDLTKDLTTLKQHFDFSNYPKDNSLYSTENKKVPGKFKDELCGEEMIEFVGIRSKMYSYRTKEDEVKKLKGITKSVVEKNIQFKDYINCIFNEETSKHKMRCLRSEDHEMYIEEINKISLNPFDDKRYILDDGIHTVAYGCNLNEYLKYKQEEAKDNQVMNRILSC